MKDSTHQAVARRLRKKGLRRDLKHQREAAKNTSLVKPTLAGPPVKSFPFQKPVGKRGQ